MGPYLNRQDLADALVSAVRQLREAQAQTTDPAFSVRCTPSPRQWRVGDRLSEADTQRLVAAFTAGTSKRKLAEHYGISESSVKRLIRQYGASKPPCGLSLSRRRSPGGGAVRSPRSAGHLLYLDIGSLTKGLTVAFRYGGCGVREAKTLPFIAALS
jgi:hypothetical protein